MGESCAPTPAKPTPPNQVVDIDIFFRSQNLFQDKFQVQFNANRRVNYHPKKLGEDIQLGESFFLG